MGAYFASIHCSFVCFLNAIGTKNHIHLESLVIPSVAVCMINLKIYKCLYEHLIMLPSFQSLQVCWEHSDFCICYMNPDRSAKGRFGGSGLLGLAFSFRKWREGRGKCITLEKLLAAEWFAPFPQNNAFLGLFQYSFPDGRAEVSSLIQLIGFCLEYVKWIFSMQINK